MPTNCTPMEEAKFSDKRKNNPEHMKGGGDIVTFKSIGKVGRGWTQGTVKIAFVF